MKRIILLSVSALLLCLNSTAQNVGIGTTTPNASAQLEIASSTRGLLLPRMTLVQRSAIVAPATGLLIYQTDNTAGFYHYNGTAWVQQSAAGYWTLSGTDIFNSNSGRVGIGTNTPLSKLHIDGGDATVSNGSLRLRGSLNPFYFDSADGTHKFQFTNFNNALWIQKIPASTPDLVIGSNGFIGMGTGSPAVKLHIYGSAGGEVLRLDAATDPQLGLTQAGVLKGVLRLGGDDIVLGSPASNDLGRLIVRLNGGDRLMVHPDGKITIGTATAANGYLLSVNGKAICTELKVQLQANWPDYVFKEDYPLKSLDELRKYVNSNNHLPGMPAARQVEQHGMEVGEMQRKMMEKLEELTLYVLQLEEKIRKIDTENSNK